MHVASNGIISFFCNYLLIHLTWLLFNILSAAVLPPNLCMAISLPITQETQIIKKCYEWSYLLLINDVHKDVSAILPYKSGKIEEK